MRRQADEVDKVKRSENGVITDPFYPFSRAIHWQDAERPDGANSAFPVFRSTEDRKLVGIITNRDLKFETDFSKKIKECMTSEGSDHCA